MVRTFSQMNLEKFFAFLLLSILGLTVCPGNIGAYDNPTTDQAYHSGRLSHDPDAADIAEGLNKAFQTLKNPSGKTARSNPAVLENRKESLPAIREIHYRPFAKTPRQIKADVSAIPQNRAKKGDQEIAGEFLSALGGLLRIDNPDEEFRFSGKQSDDLGRRHLRFSQTFQGIPVWPAELVVHLNARGHADMLDGAFVPTPRKIATRPVLNADEAFEKVCEHIPEIGQDISAESSELIIYAPGDRLPRLAWKLDISVSSDGQWLAVIDASDGRLLTAFSQISDAAVSGSGADIFGTQRSLNLWEKDGKFHMTDTAKAMYDAETSDPPVPTSTHGAIIVMDALNQPRTSEINEIPALTSVVSENPDSDWPADAVSAAYNLSQAYDYFYEHHQRVSPDGHGGSIMAVVRLGTNLESAFWDPGTKIIYFGDGEVLAASPDIVGHELTHAITTYTAGLLNKNQSGALNEAFSDIFGEMVESHVSGTEPDWIMGSRLATPLRSLSDPSSMTSPAGVPYPSDMDGYFITSGDNGGVHINMSIVAHAFYLLARGQDRAIGIRDAGQIFYRALTYHLVSNSQFADARLACIASAEELFGSGSEQALGTAEAFDAVGITDGDSTPDEIPSVSPVNSPDAVLALRYANAVTGEGRLFLCRREQEDPDDGKLLPLYNNMKMSRISVSGDGSLAAYVSSGNDLCLASTDGSSAANCLGYPGTVSSAAISRGSPHLAFVLLDENGEPGNAINVLEFLPDGEYKVRTFDLVSPVSDGSAEISVLFAGSAEFSSDGKYLVYDAFCNVLFSDGSKFGAWGIYSLDIESGDFLTLVPPSPGRDIANPSLSRTNDNFIVFDAYQATTGDSVVTALNLITGESKEVARAKGGFGYPVYTGDDSAIVYASEDGVVMTGTSLWRQPLADNKISPEGYSELFLTDATCGTVYRRGTFEARIPEIQVSPSPLSFGNVSAGGSLESEIVISNAGTSEVGIDSLSLTGTDASEFGLRKSCTGHTLYPSGSCRMQVMFSPASTGTKSAALLIRTSDGSEKSLSLSGTGIETVANVSDISVSSPSLFFENVAVGNSAGSKLGIYNRGAADINISGISVTGANASEFSVSDTETCVNQSLAPNASCEITVRFSPVSQGPKNASLLIQSGASPHEVPLSGESAGSAGEFSVSPGSLSFGEISPGENSTKVMTVYNNTADSESVTVSVSGDAASEFAVSDNCSGQTLMPGASCSFEVRFSPNSAGEKRASLLIQPNASPSEVPLTGSGAGGSGGNGSMSLSSQSLSFNNVSIGSSSKKVTRVSNTGDADLKILTVSKTGVNTSLFSLSDGCSGKTLIPGDSCAVSVAFSPNSSGTRTAEVIVQSDAPANSSAEIALTGTGRESSGNTQSSGSGDGDSEDDSSCFISAAVSGSSANSGGMLLLLLLLTVASVVFCRRPN